MGAGEPPDEQEDEVVEVSAYRTLPPPMTNPPKAIRRGIWQSTGLLRVEWTHESGDVAICIGNEAVVLLPVNSVYDLIDVLQDAAKEATP